jgi:hypothetical protein
MNEFTKGLIRHALQSAGGALAAKGVIENGQVEFFVGLVMSVLAFGWSQYRKWKRAKEEAKP